jgi:hypothetical protein
VKLHEIQPYVVWLLTNYAALAGVPIVTDDGTYPKLPAREEALQNHGACIIVWQPESDGMTDGGESLAVADRVYIPIIIEEAVTTNRTAGGTGITAPQLVEHVATAVLGHPSGGAPARAIVFGNPPWKNFGSESGIQRFVVNFTYRHRFTLNP